uniref:IGF-like family receptor 1 isoform X2 n=1 Tax=Gasterosteus aculeatus aculeatus TaxID=481459 RepID=UPI0000E3A230|nr:IGF-like family receptor 1 isoform X2 [Gasterosteus aculeatus aculeatus]
MGHSEKCRDLDTFWDQSTSTCKECPRAAGREITPNCGFDDLGGRHEVPWRECKKGTFNDGSSAHCKPCAQCPPGFIYAHQCTTTSDTKCEASGRGTGHPVTIRTERGFTLKPHPATTPPPLYTEAAGAGIITALAFAIVITITLGVICACLIWRRKRGRRHAVLGFHRRSSHINSGFSPLSALDNDLRHILSPDILSSPLQTVLDNLDVLEELVILLDPENQGVKNTKHLASHCSFPATWITYIYSMKDSKSPLKAVLEGVNSKHPDWTVGHLAERLKLMERNDAIAVLSKLGECVMQA